MKIANNIIKAHLKNVYFLCGGAYGGKTTMAKLLEEKHGFFYNLFHRNKNDVKKSEKQQKKELKEASKKEKKGK